MLAENPECNKIVDNLKKITELLDLEQDKGLLTDIDSLCNYVLNPNFIVSVFGSFNRGKSTLLNALLGNKLLPAALIPTTGAAINIKYGIELETRIVLSDGTKINEKGTEALQSFTRLNNERQMRSDIISVEMLIPNPLLKNGIELIDLPGTNDQEEQDELVRNRLLSTDLIINVLDASQLFTLTEAENLQYWLIEREITTVIFVVNFLNLLEVEDQIMVMQRARSLAEEFRGNFPDGISNLYRVDALPALKAKRKGEIEAAFRTGILNFESALQNIANVLSNELSKYRLPRVIKFCNQVKQSLEAKIQTIEADLEVLITKHSEQIQKVDKLKIIFQDISSNFIKWLSIDSLLSTYQSTLAKALKDNNFKTWEQNFYKVLNQYIETLNECTEKACNISQQKKKSKKLSISLPSQPNIINPKTPEIQDARTKRSVAIATGVGWFVLGPIGGAIAAGATHYVNEKHKQKQQDLLNEYNSGSVNVYTQAAEKYLEQVKNISITQFNQYQKEVENIFNLFDTGESEEAIAKKHQLHKFTKALTDL
jgi:GTPase SAR1 family protein